MKILPTKIAEEPDLLRIDAGGNLTQAPAVNDRNAKWGRA
jgi:hypothetical protein